MRPAVVYRMYDDEGALLYVGCTMAPGTRIPQHSVKSWFHTVSTVKLEHFADRPDAAAAELKAIQTESPLYNRLTRLDNPWPRVRRERDADDVVSIGEVAKRTGTDRDTLLGWIEDGRLRVAFRTPGGHRRFFWGDVEACLTDAATGAA